MKNANEYRRLLDAMNPEIRSETITLRNGQKTTIRGTDEERLATRAMLNQLGDRLYTRQRATVQGEVRLV